MKVSEERCTCGHLKHEHRLGFVRNCLAAKWCDCPDYERDEQRAYVTKFRPLRSLKRP